MFIQSWFTEMRSGCSFDFVNTQHLKRVFGLWSPTSAGKEDLQSYINIIPTNENIA